MTNSDTKIKRGRKPKIKVTEFNSQSMSPETPPTLTIKFDAQRPDTELDMIIDKCKFYIEYWGASVDEALAACQLSRKTAPTLVMRALIKHSLNNKVSLFNNVTPEERAQYIRASDFNAYMKAVDDGDVDKQVALSKILRSDQQLNMNVAAPSLIVNISELKDVLRENHPDIIDITPQPHSNSTFDFQLEEPLELDLIEPFAVIVFLKSRLRVLRVICWFQSGRLRTPNNVQVIFATSGTNFPPSWSLKPWGQYSRIVRFGFLLP